MHILFMIPDRPNLFLDYRKWEGPWGSEDMNAEVMTNNLQWLLKIVTSPNCPNILIFVPETKTMTKMYTFLFCYMLDNNLDPKALLNQVCGSSDATHKSKLLEKFSKGPLKVVVCTKVWGSGIDFSNVKLVVCFSGANQTLRDDWQEGGRAGRNNSRGAVVTYKVPSGGKSDPDLIALFKESGCKRDFILKRLTLKDKDKEFRLPVTPFSSTDKIPSDKMLCKICTCCSTHFEEHNCESISKGPCCFIMSKKLTVK